MAHVVFGTETEFGPDTPQRRATKGIFTPPPSQQDEGGEEKYQKSTEAIHSFTGPLTHTH